MDAAAVAIKTAPLKELAFVIVDAVLRKKTIEAVDTAKQVSAALANFVGTSLEIFEKLEFSNREFLRSAATVVSDRYTQPRSLFGFLRNAIGHLNKIARASTRDLTRIAIFLMGIVDIAEARALKSRMIAYC